MSFNEHGNIELAPHHHERDSELRPETWTE